MVHTQAWLGLGGVVVHTLAWGSVVHTLAWLGLEGVVGTHTGLVRVRGSGLCGEGEYRGWLTLS